MKFVKALDEIEKPEAEIDLSGADQETHPKVYLAVVCQYRVFESFITQDQIT